MVNVVTSPQSLQKTLEYNFRKVEAGKASILFSQNVSVDDRGLPSFLNTYRDMLALIPKCRTKKITFSCSLNPNPNEKVSDETLTLLAREYMQDLGYGSQPFVVFKHFDIEREHIHIVTTRVDRTGKKINDAFEQERARRIVDKLEIKYGLMPSKNNKYAKQEAKPISLEPSAPSASPASPMTEKVVTASSNSKAQPISGEKELTRQVRAILGDVLGKWQFSSIGEMNAILARYNLTAEFTQNEHKRKFYNGIVYIPLGAKGNKTGTPITGTEAGRGFGHSAVLHHFKTSKKTILSHLSDMPIAIADVMKQKPKTPEDFRQKLSVLGYEVLFRTNDKGRIYGVTFIDDRNKIVVNGSKLGKAFSANAFNAYFNEGGKWSIDFDFSKAREKYHGDFTPAQTKNDSRSNNHNRIKDDDTSIADLTDLIGLNTPEPDDSEYQEQKFQRRLRRQAQKAMGVKRRRH